MIDQKRIYEILDYELPGEIDRNGIMRIDTSRWDDTTLEIDVGSIVSRIMELIKDA